MLRRPFLRLLICLGLLTPNLVLANGLCRRLLLGKGASLAMNMRISDGGDIKVAVLAGDLNALGRSLNSIGSKLLGRALRLDEIQPVVKRFLADKTNEPFYIKLANAFQMQITADLELENQIKERLGLIKINAQGQAQELKGPYPAVLFAAKHTSNGSETMALAALVSKYRSDVKVALTRALAILPGMAENSILLDISGTPGAKVYNESQREKMQQHIGAGGVLVIHPSATVAVTDLKQGGRATEPFWRNGIAELMIRNPQAKLVFVNFNHQAASTYMKYSHLKFIGDLIRPILHVREIANNVGTQFETAISGAFTADELNSRFGGDRKRMLAYMRSLTNLLSTRFVNTAERVLELVINETPRDLIAADVGKMKELAEFRGLKVYAAKGSQIPNVLRELGRLRELSYRTVGEGTGRSMDVDGYDQHYHHIVVINPEDHQIIGAYRLGLIDEVYGHKGIAGLYTSQFFDFGSLLSGQSGADQDALLHTIEAGRTFANFEAGRLAIYFQKAVWKGLAKFIIQNPKYRSLMGAVSISNSYSLASKSLIVEYLINRRPHRLRGKVKAVHAVPTDRYLQEDIQTVLSATNNHLELNRAVVALDGRAMPPLIKSYGDLHGEYVAFDFDRDFNTWDGMVMIDLRKAPTKELLNYFEGTDLLGYYQFHGWSEKVNELQGLTAQSP